MNPLHKKIPEAKGFGQQLKPQAGGAYQFKPVVAQSKNAVSAPNSARPAAPAAYRPEPKPAPAQAKTPNLVQAKARLVVPPVYRPQPVPKVLQLKTTHTPPRAAQAETESKLPVALPAYRPPPVPQSMQMKKAGGGGQILTSNKSDPTVHLNHHTQRQNSLPPNIGAQQQQASSGQRPPVAQTPFARSASQTSLIIQAKPLHGQQVRAIQSPYSGAIQRARDVKSEIKVAPFVFNGPAVFNVGITTPAPPAPRKMRLRGAARGSVKKTSAESLEAKRLKTLINRELSLSDSDAKWGGQGVVLDMKHEYMNVSSGHKAELQVEGLEHGCHTCSSDLTADADQPWIADHIPPTNLKDSILDALKFPKVRLLYPQCDTCAEKQSSLVIALNSGADLKGVSKDAIRFLLTPGRAKYKGVPSNGPKVNSQEGKAVQALGVQYGCHSCGKENPKDRYHADHCPPKEFYTSYMSQVLLLLGYAPITVWRAKPQCPRCSNGQGGHMANLTRLAKSYAKKNGIVVYS